MKKFAVILSIAVLFGITAVGCGRIGTGSNNSTASTISSAGSQAQSSTAGNGTSVQAQSATGKVSGINSDAQAVEKLLGQIASDAAGIDVSSESGTQADSLTSQINSMLNGSNDDITGLN